MPGVDIHARSIATSSALSEYYVPHFIVPRDVIRVLNAAKIKFMLVGAHGIGGWMRKARASADVDVVVGLRSVKKAVRTLLAAFPGLEADDQPIVVRLRDPETKDVVIDVIKPHEPLFQSAFKHCHSVKSEGEAFLIPSLELALATRFAAMISLNRAERDRLQDAHDFMYIVDSNPDIDLDTLAELGQLVYNDGGAEIVEKVRQVRAGERLQL
jgi:hypothetical protein